MAFVASASAFVAIVAAGAAAIFSGFWWFFLGIPVGIVLIFVARAVKRRSPEAAELHAQYAALERYLKDFGRLDEKPPDAVVLWEQFLIYAVVFGIADQVAKAMTVKVPEVVQRPGVPHAVPACGGGCPASGGLSAFSEIHQSFSAGGLRGDVVLVVRLGRRRRLLRRRRRWRRRRRLRRRLSGTPPRRRPRAQPSTYVRRVVFTCPSRREEARRKRATSPRLRKAYGECTGGHHGTSRSRRVR